MAIIEPVIASPRAKIYFFDVRDALGEVDRPGHLVLYPSTLPMLAVLRKQGFRIGVIMSLPDNVTSEQGRKLLQEAGLVGDG